MADKEERICICKLEGNATESVCGGSMTRQEAIEKMAKEMARRELARMQPRFNPTKEEYESIWAYEVLPNTQKRFRDQAEAAINALLGVEQNGK